MRAGLHDPAYERDSCGFGLIASLDDLPSHELVRTALHSLQRLTHRGAIAEDGKTGDGCGLLLKAPQDFLRALGAEAGLELAERFAAGVVFLPAAPDAAAAARAVLAAELAGQGLQCAGWRAVPHDPDACGAAARASLPRIEQVFVNAASATADADGLERALFVARRRAESALAHEPQFYVPSLSTRTLVYKGMVMPEHLARFYPDLADPRLSSSVAVFHQRFSTNTLPQWRLAHPYRYLAHNGEINTIQGNRNWALARGPLLRSALVPQLAELQPHVSLTGSDSQSLDNMLEVLLMGGLDPLHAMRLLMPPAWHGLDTLDPDLRAFYEYYSAHMEPWDGPAGVVLTDGRYALCTLDRNGLRPARYCLTANRWLTVASESGVWDYPPEAVLRQGKLGPGDMLALDLASGTLLQSADIDQRLKARHPYKSWLKQGVRYLESDLVDPRLAAEPMDRSTLALYQKMFNVTQEEREEIIRVLAQDENEAVGSMGDDTPLPVLSQGVRSLYEYFRQQFAQVTNPPIDPLRETLVMSLQTQIGPECNIFEPAPEHARQIVLGSPILSQRKLRQILALEEVTHEFLDLQHDPAQGLRAALARLCAQAEAAVREGKLVLLLSDRYLVKGRVPVHALLATGAVHQHLVATGQRCKCNLLIETGTAREPHHFACLIGYGATAVYPYMAYQVLFDMMRRGQVKLDFAARL
ncbi:MAG: glutamate synthase large subunit, partial [Gammaproteobacteria bacterium]|nr:glutamate synthase large subunit [Gammaproteobacteria bacterium]